ncbi:MAG: alpha/beta hydrolase [Cyanobacteria bacterium P01_G01_bin.19]
MDLNTEIKGQGYPILCLHGHPGSSNSMSVFTNYLSQQYLTITPDLRGYGKSKYKQDFVMEDHLQDLVELLDKFNIDRFLLLGWSLGGIIAIELALLMPERFSGMISIATAAKPLGIRTSNTWKDQLFTGIGGIINLIKPGWQWNIDTFGKRSLFRFLIENHSPESYNYLAKEGTPAYFRTSKAASRALFGAIKKGYDRLGDLHQIDFPCLMLSGECDRNITASASKKTAEHLPNCEYINYPQVAHLFPWEIPELVLKDIQQWLDRHEFC